MTDDNQALLDSLNDWNPNPMQRIGMAFSDFFNSKISPNQEKRSPQWLRWLLGHSLAQFDEVFRCRFYWFCSLIEAVDGTPCGCILCCKSSKRFDQTEYGDEEGKIPRYGPYFDGSAWYPCISGRTEAS